MHKYDVPEAQSTKIMKCMAPGSGSCVLCKTFIVLCKLFSVSDKASKAF